MSREGEKGSGRAVRQQNWRGWRAVTWRVGKGGSGGREVKMREVGGGGRGEVVRSWRGGKGGRGGRGGVVLSWQGWKEARLVSW